MWSISASGPKDNVANKIQNAAQPGGAELAVFRAAQRLCLEQLELVASDTATVLAGGDERTCNVVVHGGHLAEGESVEPDELEDEGTAGDGEPE